MSTFIFSKKLRRMGRPRQVLGRGKPIDHQVTGEIPYKTPEKKSHGLNALADL